MRAHRRNRVGNHRRPSMDGGAAISAQKQISTRAGKGGRKSQVAKRILSHPTDPQGVARMDLAPRLRRHGDVHNSAVTGTSERTMIK